MKKWSLFKELIYPVGYYELYFTNKKTLSTYRTNIKVDITNQSKFTGFT